MPTPSGVFKSALRRSGIRGQRFREIECDVIKIIFDYVKLLITEFRTLPINTFACQILQDLAIKQRRYNVFRRIN